MSNTKPLKHKIEDAIIAIVPGCEHHNYTINHNVSSVESLPFDELYIGIWDKKDVCEASLLFQIPKGFDDLPTLLTEW